MDASLMAGWENFYVIIGSSAASLTGITLVVIALIRDVQRVRPTGLRAFVTPTIVHFGGVLALAAYLSMPRHGVLSLSVGFGVAGLAGLIYGGVIAANMRSQCLGHCSLDDRSATARTALRMSYVSSAVGLGDLDRRDEVAIVHVGTHHH